MITICSFLSKHQKSNTWLLWDQSGRSIIIDPGDPDPTELLEFISKNNIKVTGIFLTHEHSDHCAGINKLRSDFNYTIYGSEACISGIANPKQNFSEYIEDIDSFTVNGNSTILQDNESVSVLSDRTLTILETPGHSPGSTCYFIDQYCFTGDTLLPGIKTPLTFPHSDRKAYEQSMIRLKLRLSADILIMPGHGDPFYYTPF